MDWKTSAQICLREKYADVNGRAMRSEFWWFMLFILVVSTVLSVIDSFLFGPVFQGVGPLSLIFSLMTIIPAITVTARRLHDIDRTGWWQLLLLLPLIGFVVIVYFCAQKGTAGPNTYGPDPLASAVPA